MAGSAAGTRVVAAVTATVLLSGCSGIQSVLNPGGRNAAQIATLWWYMFGVGMAIFALVIGLYAYVLLTTKEQRPKISEDAMVFAGGVALPVICFSILLPMSFGVARLATADVPPGTLQIEIQAQQFWWKIRYVIPGRPDLSLTTANEIHLPIGQPAEIWLTSADVIHSFWVPGLSGKMQLIPGIRNRTVIEADKPGIYRGECAMLCGLSHAKMALYVVAESPRRFQAWMTHQLSPAIAPQAPEARAGYAAFRTRGCIFCHTVRGLDAWGVIGPDLTHVGGRLSIAAGTFPTSPPAFADWITHNQVIKPDNKMLSFAALPPETVKSIALFLNGLK